MITAKSFNAMWLHVAVATRAPELIGSLAWRWTFTVNRLDKTTNRNGASLRSRRRNQKYVAAPLFHPCRYAHSSKKKLNFYLFQQHFVFFLKIEFFIRTLFSYLFHEILYIFYLGFIHDIVSFFSQNFDLKLKIKTKRKSFLPSCENVFLVVALILLRRSTSSPSGRLLLWKVQRVSPLPEKVAQWLFS